MITMLLPHEITVTSPGTTTDRYGNSVPSWTTGVTTVTTRGYLQPLVTGESTVDRQAVEYGYVVFTIESLDPHSRVTHDGRTYEVTGPSRPWDTPTGSHHHETFLRVTEG